MVEAVRHRRGLVIWLSLLIILSGVWFALSGPDSNVEYYRVVLQRAIYARYTTLLNRIDFDLAGQPVLLYYLFNKDIMLFGAIAVAGSFMAWRLALYANRSL